MVDKVGSGAPPSAPPQTTSTDKVDSAKASDTQPATTQTPADSSPPPASTEQKGQTQKFSEFALSGMARAAQFTNFTGPEPPKLPTDELLKRNDNQKEPKPEVQELQKQVNQWRAENGKPPIKEDGFFGPKTEKAVYEFQKANGLQKDGQAGIQTQNRVLMENDSNFKQLDGGIKDQTRKLMSDYGKDKGKVENLRNFATSPGLGKLSTAHQQQMLDIQKAHPDDTKLTSQLGTLANDGTFQKLNDSTKTEVLNQVSGYAGDPGKIDNLTKLATSKGFEQLSNDHQKKMMDALKTRPDDAQLAEGLGKMASSPGFRNSSDKVKDSLIDTISKNPPTTADKVDNTLNLIGSPGFTKLTDANIALITDG
ncbi:peptidoglycan-binding protein, partial [bacterium]|nr:peptidoglycan-binding protein [bacterium]